MSLCCCRAARDNSVGSRGRNRAASVPWMRDDDFPGHLGNSALYGRVASVDLARGRLTAKVGDVETLPIRWFTGGAGGTKVWTRPRVGEQILLFAPDGDLAGAIAMRGVTSDANPPIGDEAREVVQFEDGAAVAYDPAEHAMEIVLPAGATVKIVAPGGVRLEADVTISGDLTVDGAIAAQGDVKAGTVSMRQHVHAGVQPGGGLSQAPRA